MDYVNTPWKSSGCQFPKNHPNIQGAGIAEGILGRKSDAPLAGYMTSYFSLLGLVSLSAKWVALHM